MRFVLRIFPARVTVMPSWRDVLRTPALRVLSKMRGSAAQELYHRYAK